MKELLLNGEYKLFEGENFVCNAMIPGSDFGNMIRNHIIENPMNCSNQKKFEDIVQSVYYADHVFERTFTVDADLLEYTEVVLHCEKIDTICHCYINGKLAFESNNVHIAVDCNVKNLLNTGENTIRFEIASPVKYIERKQKEDPLPKNFNGIGGAAHIRKAACHFGWDWGPCIPYKYVGDVKIQAYNKKIRLNKICQQFSENKVKLTVDCENVSSFTLIHPDGKVEKFDTSTEIVNPSLWYCRDLLNGKNPDLYTLILENDEERIERKIGIRQIELNRSSDEYGNNFQFILNGKRVFAKGANVIPFSVIPEFVTEEKIDYYLDLCVKSNFNMIRIWGGAEYASEYLLNRCDELGIMVWQDFCFACLLYPLYDEGFRQNVMDEIAFNIPRLELHPCLALWCGNNEIESMFSWMPKELKTLKAYEQFFWHDLQDYMTDNATVPYIPSSPLGKAPFERNTADEVGDTHMWNVWHGLKPLDYYQSRYTRFLSEFGLESLPSMKAISTFASQKDFSLSSEAFMTHQKCKGGNKKMLFYLQERFFLPKSFEYLPYMTGIVQSECVQYATEHFRRNKGRCNGSIYWQLNDVWNCSSWSSVDYEGVPKALIYKGRSFMAPVSVSYKDGKFYLCNDTLFDMDIPVEFYINGESETVNVSSKADSVKEIFEYNLKTGDYVKVRWLDYELNLDRIRNLPQAHFDVVRGKDYLTIRSDTYAKNVYIESDSIADDNYFCLLPGEEKTVLFSGQIGNYRVICENNIITENKRLKRFADRQIYRLRPENITNYIYYDKN